MLRSEPCNESFASYSLAGSRSCPWRRSRIRGLLKKDKLAVFVGEVSSRNGFVDADPGTLDSIKDVKEALSRKHIRLVSDIDDAEVVIRILGRKKTSEDIGAFIADVGPSTITGRRYADYRILGAQIEARNYKSLSCPPTPAHGGPPRATSPHRSAHGLRPISTRC